MGQYADVEIINALESHQNMPPKVRRYFEHSLNGTLPEYYLTVFINKRYGYAEELPSVDVRTLFTLDERGRFGNTKWKCRETVLMGIMWDLESSIDDGVITDLSIIEQFKSIRESDFKTRADLIDTINKTLEMAIKYLRTKTAPNSSYQWMALCRDC